MRELLYAILSAAMLASYVLAWHLGKRQGITIGHRSASEYYKQKVRQFR